MMKVFTRPTSALDYCQKKCINKGPLFEFGNYSQKLGINVKGPSLKFMDFRQKQCKNDKGPRVPIGIFGLQS
jgi:hypothetical protein